MRQFVPGGFHFDESVSYPLTFNNTKGHVLLIYVTSSNTIRVKHLLPGEASEALATASSQRVSFAVTKSDEDDKMELQTPDIRLVIHLDPFWLEWFQVDSSREAFAADLAHRAYAVDTFTGARWHYQRRIDGNHYYGLGERTGNLDLGGRRFRLERVDSMGYDAETQDPLYKFCPFYIVLNSVTKCAYGIFYHSFGTSTMDLGQELDAMWGPFTYYNVESGPMDYTMILGPLVSTVASQFCQMTGRPKHLPPRYAFGYLASGMGYAEQDNAQERLEKFASDCREHNIPCDGIHLSSGYTAIDGEQRCVFTWNTSRFPDPERLATHLHENGIRVFANIKPWLLAGTHPDYGLVRDQGGLVLTEDSQPGTVWQWRGAPGTAGKASYIDFTSRAGYDYWRSRVRTQLLDKGYYVWLDNNEFTMSDDSHLFACEVQPAEYAPEMQPLPQQQTSARDVGTPFQTLLMIQASYDALIHWKPNERPFLITRSTTPYSQRLVTQTWSGDNTTDWKTIDFNIAMGLGASLCSVAGGYGHDVGGFAGSKPTAEMLVRWVQQGIFWPRFCIHSLTADPADITEPWMYPEVLPTIREAIHFRYRLIPYLYSIHVSHFMWRCEPLVRPVFYDHQADIMTHCQQSEFMLGSDLLIAPVFHPGATNRSVYLPKDTAWYHYQDGAYYRGGSTVTVAAALDDAFAPLFVKAGSILCFGKVMRHVKEQVDNERRIQVFPDRYTDEGSATSQRTTFHLIEDDGETLYHETGRAYADIEIWMESDQREIRVGISILHDGYFPDYDTLWVTCPIQSETRKLVFIDSGTSGSQRQQQCERLVHDDMNTYLGIKIR